MSYERGTPVEAGALPRKGRWATSGPCPCAGPSVKSQPARTLHSSQLPLAAICPWPPSAPDFGNLPKVDSHDVLTFLFQASDVNHQ